MNLSGAISTCMEREERDFSRVILCGRLPKPVPQRLCGCPKETLVGADRHELDSLFKVAASVRFHGGKNAGEEKRWRMGGGEMEGGRWKGMKMVGEDVRLGGD